MDVFLRIAAFGMFLAGLPVVAQTALTQVGVTDGAEFRVDIPANWNHSLVVYYHGYALVPTHFGKGQASGATKPFLDRGYAVIQSGFSVYGWALPQAYVETEALRKSFVKQHGQPRETYVSGQSMGGALTMMTLERDPEPYNGALNLCGAVLPTNEWAQRRFALAAAFQYYFPGILPNLAPAPVNFVESDALKAKLLAALKADPAKAAIMQRLTALYRDQDVAHLMQYVVYQVSDFSRKGGGNPVDNANWIYTGTGTAEEDYRLNDGVKRYNADPKARAWMIRNYTATGRLKKPMLAVHTVYDTLIPANSLAEYSERVSEAGSTNYFTQQYVDHIGHCAFTSDEIGRAFDELVGWVHGAPQPKGGKLP